VGDAMAAEGLPLTGLQSFTNRRSCPQGLSHTLALQCDVYVQFVLPERCDFSLMLTGDSIMAAKKKSKGKKPAPK